MSVQSGDIAQRPGSGPSDDTNHPTRNLELKRSFTIHLIPLGILCSNACNTATTVKDDVPDAPVKSEMPVEPDKPVVAVVPGEGCPEVEPDLTTIVGAKLDRRGLHIRVRTTTWCDEHEFTVHRCDVTERATTYRVSETNDCEMPNDGVIQHILFVERQHPGEVGHVETFDAETVTVTE